MLLHIRIFSTLVHPHAKVPLSPRKKASQSAHIPRNSSFSFYLVSFLERLRQYFSEVFRSIAYLLDIVSIVADFKEHVFGG